MSSPAGPPPASADGYDVTATELDARLIRIAAVVIVGAFMSILDVTIVNVAINELATEFDATLAQIQWISTGYMLALATVIPLTGWAADRFGTKRLFMISIGLFLAGSALAGMAWSVESLIAFRVLQGLGGGMVMPAGMTILTHAAGPQRMGRVMALVGVPMLLAPIVGPILGGWLVNDVSWHWIFFVNVPVGLVALVLAYRIFEPDRPSPEHRLDWKGVLLLPPGLALFVFGLAEIASHGTAGSAQTIVGVGAGLLLLTAFVIHARGDADPLLDVRLFARRAVAPAAGTTTIFSAAFFGTALLLPLWFQIVHGQTALQSGLLLVPQGVGAMITMPIAGRLTDRIGAGRIVLVGLTLVAIAMGLLSTVDETTSFTTTSLILLINGFGMGSTMMPAMSAALRTLQRGEVARATSGLNALQRVGGSIGTAVLAVVLTHQLQGALPAGGGESGLSAARDVPPEAQQQLMPLIADAFGKTFLWSFAITIVAFAPALFLSRRKPEHAAAGRPPLVVE